MRRVYTIKPNIVVSHVSKILTKIVHKQKENKIEDILTEDQF